MYNKMLKKLLLIDILKIVKSNYNWDQLSEYLNEPPSVLSRYYRGRILPSDDKAEKLYNRLVQLLDLEEAIIKRIKINRQGFLNNQGLIGDITFLRIAALEVAKRFGGKYITKIVSPATDGVPFATIVAEVLNVPLVIAKKYKEVGVRRYIEGSYTTDDGFINTFYIDRDLIKQRDIILIVDDILRTGSTYKCILDMFRRLKTDVAGIMVLIAIGDRWKKALSEEKIEYILKLHI
jgi:adenine phosphoribosyltransferase